MSDSHTRRPADGKPVAPNDAHDDRGATVADLRAILRDFVDQRNWQGFHNPKNLVMSLSIEVAELMEHFQWLTPEQADQVCEDPETRQEIADEVSDCLAYLLTIANRLDLDLTSGLRDKMIRNALKYPAPDDPHEVASPKPRPSH